MSARDRLEDARALTAAGRREGAFIQVLIATAATSRLRYPRAEWDDSESFRNFIYDEMGVISGGPKYEVKFPFRGKETPLEDILYHHLRCQLLHEASMPESIRFSERREDGANVVELQDVLGFPEGWIDRIATAVWLAPENDHLWADDEERRVRAREALGDLVHCDSFCRRPGQQSKRMKGRNERLTWSKNGDVLSISHPPSVTNTDLPSYLREWADDLESP